MSFPRLNRFFAVLAFVALILPFAAIAGDDTGGNPAPAIKNKTAGLSCFSIEPPKAETSRKREDYPTCDDLCAEKGAACTGMQNSSLNPPVTCADHTSSTWSVCRCCKVQQ